MRTLHFVRHGQSAANAGLPTSDNALIPLTAAGVAQARALAAALNVAAPRVLASNYLRAQQTAAPFCDRLDRRCESHELLHEFVTLDPAAVAGTTNVQRAPMVKAYWDAADPDLRTGPGAETFREFAQRVAAAQIMLPQLDGDTVIFGHGMWFSLLIWRLLGFTRVDRDGMQAFRAFQLSLPMPNCAVYRLHEGASGRPWGVVAHEALMRAMTTLHLTGEAARS